MLKSNLYDYSDAYILLKGTIIIIGARADAAAQRADQNNKQVKFEKYAPFTNCIIQINNTQVENTEYLDVVIPRYNLIE